MKYPWNDELKGDVVKFLENLVQYHKRLIGSPHRNEEAKAEQLLARLKFEQEESELEACRNCDAVDSCKFSQGGTDYCHEYKELQT